MPTLVVLLLLSPVLVVAEELGGGTVLALVGVSEVSGDKRKESEKCCPENRLRCYFDRFGTDNHMICLGGIIVLFGKCMKDIKFTIMPTNMYISPVCTRTHKNDHVRTIQIL